MQELWSTDKIRRGDRCRYWIEAVSGAFVPSECEIKEADRGFFGHVKGGRLATMNFWRVTAAAQKIRRTQVKISEAHQDYFFVSVQNTGKGVLLQDGRRAEFGPDDFILYDTTRPYELTFTEEFDGLVLTIPGPALRTRFRGIENLTGRSLEGRRGAGRLFTNMVRTLALDFDCLEPRAAAAVAESVENILIAGLSSLPGVADTGLSNMSALRRDQVKAYILENLRDPDLSVDAVAAFLGVAPSTVHRSFSDEPSSLNSWIWARRLDQARSDLSNPAFNNQTITDIAFGCGFNDASHFSRAFRSRFGCSPRELRSGCLAPN